MDEPCRCRAVHTFASGSTLATGTAGRPLPLDHVAIECRPVGVVHQGRVALVFSADDVRHLSGYASIIMARADAIWLRDQLDLHLSGD